MKRITRGTLALLLALTLILPMLGHVALASGEVATINFWYWDVSMDATYKAMFDAYSAEHPNVKVTLTQAPWSDYWTKLQTALPTGEGPDIFWLNHPNAVTYLPTGLVSSIQQYIDSGAIDMSNFAQSLYDPYTIGGQVYCVPIFFDTIAIAYNKQILTEAGYPDGPPADWTWKDLKDIAKTLTTDGVYGFASSSDGQSTTMDFILQNGSDLYSEDGLTSILAADKNVETIKFLLGLIEDKVSPTQAEQKEIPSLDMFQNDMIAMIPFGLWSTAPTYEIMGDNLGIAPNPKNVRQGTIVHNLGYAASAQTKHPAEVAELMAYFASKDHGDRIAEVFAPAYTASQELWFQKFGELSVNVFTDGLAYAKGLMISKKNAGQVFSLYETEMDKLFQMNNPDIKVELTRIQELLNAEIAK